MKPLLLAFIAFPVMSFAQYTYKNLEVNYLDKPGTVSSYTYKNLRLYPVMAKDGFARELGAVGKYMTLQEALDKNKIRVTEKSSSGTVSTLSVENISVDTIIIITGDMVKGGKQDRIINTDMVLQPNNGKKDLPVYCVESGRWSAGTASSNRSSQRDQNYFAKSSAPAEFKSYESKGSVSLRKVVEKEKEQSKVWNKVDELNNANKTTTSTKTYMAITQSDDFSNDMEKYISFFKDKFSSDKRVIGVIVASGGKVIGCDMFASHDLFMKQYPSLLRSYATEAIINGKPVTVTTTVVKAYTDKLMLNESVQQATLKEKGSAFSNQGKKLRVSSYD